MVIVIKKLLKYSDSYIMPAIEPTPALQVAGVGSQVSTPR
jgi:hypothetical protein